MNMGDEEKDKLEVLDVNGCTTLIINSREHGAQLLHELTQIRATLAQHGEILQAILKRSNLESDALIQNADMKVVHSNFEFPLKCCDQIQRLDEYARTDNGLSLCVKFLATAGGSNLEEAVQRILSSLFSDEILSAYSLKGKRHKSAFIGFTGVLSIIKVCANSNPALVHLKVLGKLNDESVCKGISLTLKKACDRVTQRHRRETNSND